ncbi:MAG TPA: histidine kinase N-terminal 7TM domain-containing protein [Leptolinea sp.]
MNFIFLPHVWILLITATLSFTVGVSAFQRKSLLTGRILTLLMLSISIWAFSSGIEAGSIGLSQKVFWAKMEYIGFVWAAPLTFFFILAYTNRWKWVKPPVLIVLGTMSIITLSLAWTNDYHGLIWNAFHQGNDQLNVLIYNHGTWYWIFAAFYYALFLASLIILIRDFRHLKSPYRQQTISIILATLLPAVAGILYMFKISPIPGLDWMPIFTFFTGLLFSWSMFRYRLLNLVPIARDILVEQMLDGMIVLDDQQRVIDINPSARTMLMRGDSIKIGDSLASAIPELWVSYADANNRTKTRTLTVPLTSNQLRYVDIRCTAIKGKSVGDNCSLLILKDITKRKTAEDMLNHANIELENRIVEIQKLQHQLREDSIRDPLTDLYNRRYLEDALQREFARARRDSYQVSIIMIDIDHFKIVNDSFGHATGDVVLQRLSNMLASSFRLEDIVCRYGGEEFLIVMPATSIETALARIEKFRELLEQTTMEISNQKVRITISSGVAGFPDDGASINEVIEVSDRAMYQAKAAGRNRVIAGI